ncbi:hypothetical protein F3157_13760 [Virgibacillus dakarensis]|uniref:YppG-like protein n=1 Tax=Lentibacillus populi TaxID=1827502 RepID=A0A9W5U0R7_9BACI|nr:MULTISPECIES: YppG family protein [Bacillaceae]MBT2217675.1 YppG family protein [Virgibacillus dakarensis]MTW86719.1 hypothetical protein [Virgibacillus dakarensis]GGB57150.1 hypothetical protein GCM10011409_38350 [Lentibacillus populi]
MFPGRPRRPVPPPSPFGFGPGPMQRQQMQNRPGLLSMFQTPDGNFDFEKISSTAKQVNDIYRQVSPMISPMVSKFFNR